MTRGIAKYGLAWTTISHRYLFWLNLERGEVAHCASYFPAHHSSLINKYPDSPSPRYQICNPSLFTPVILIPTSTSQNSPKSPSKSAFKMGKGGRMICIFTPYVLTIAALICLIVVGLGSTDNGTDSLRDLYFFRVCLLSGFC